MYSNCKYAPAKAETSSAMPQEQTYNETFLIATALRLLQPEYWEKLIMQKRKVRDMARPAEEG